MKRILLLEEITWSALILFFFAMAVHFPRVDALSGHMMFALIVIAWWYHDQPQTVISIVTAVLGTIIGVHLHYIPTLEAFAFVSCVPLGMTLIGGYLVSFGLKQKGWPVPLWFLYLTSVGQMALSTAGTWTALYFLAPKV